MQDSPWPRLSRRSKGGLFCPEGRAVVARIAASRTDENIANRSSVNGTSSRNRRVRLSRQPCRATAPGSGEPSSHLKKLLGRHAEQDPPDLFEMGGACLDLLRKRVHIAEAALERAAREDRVDARSLVGEVCHLDRAMDRVGA